MLTTKFIFQNADDLNMAWTVAMKEDSMTREQIMETNISKVANEIIEQKDTIVFHLSGVLLRGIVRIYSKKTNYVLSDCNDTLEKISLRFQKTEHVIQDERPLKQKNSNNLEIDNETIELWKKEVNLESVINAEKEESINYVNAELEAPNRITNEIITEIPTFENDLGEVPLDLQIVNDIYDDEIPANTEPKDIEVQNLQSDIIFNEENKTKKNSRFKIDVSPIIPMSQLSLILENTKFSLCKRPITKKENKTSKKIIVNNTFNELLQEAKRRSSKYLTISSEVEFPEIQEIPIDPIESCEVIEKDIINDDNTPLCNNIEISEIEKRIFYSEKNRINFLDIVKRDKRSLANSFYQILALKNQGKIEISQEVNESNLWIEKM